MFEAPRRRQIDTPHLHGTAPPPFVIKPDVDAPSVAEADAEISAGIVLIGEAEPFLPEIVEALELAGRLGFGPERATGTLQSVDRVDQASAPAAAGSGVEIELLTPLRLRRDGHVLRSESLSGSDLIASLIRRVVLLEYLYCGSKEYNEINKLVELASATDVVGRDLRWKEQRRWSGRRRCELPMGGLVGAFTLSLGSSPSMLWPYLWLGQSVHCGNGASMGMGEYRLAPCRGT